MRLFKKKLKASAAKVLFAGVISFGSIGLTSGAFAQASAPPAPPSPGEVLNSINPFKKKRKVTETKKENINASATTPMGLEPPPPPPNPIEVLKKKKIPTPPAPGS